MDNDKYNELLQGTISDKEFDELLDNELDHIKEFFKQPSPDWIPSLKVLTRKDFGAKPELVMVVLGDFDSQNKRKIMFALGQKMWNERKKTGMPVAVAFTSEAWFKKFDKEEDYDGKSLADYEDKEESLVTFGLTVDGRRSMAVHSIKRNKDNDIEDVALSMYAPASDKTKTKMESDLVKEFFKGCAHQALSHDKEQ